MTQENERIIELTFTADSKGERLDAFIVRKLENVDLGDTKLSRSRVQKLIRDGYVHVNSEIKKKNYDLEINDSVQIQIPPDKVEIKPDEKITFDIIHEDEFLIIVSKPAGVVTHPTPHAPSGTLVNGVMALGISLAAAGGKYRPGVMHRLDREASGIITLAKTDQAYYGMAELFKDRDIEKYYRAIIYGNMRELTGTINLDIGRHPSNRSKMAVVKKGGKEARTDFTVDERFDGFESLRLRIHSGRTHQIRVHLSNSGHSILNDHVYGGLKFNAHIRELAQKSVTAKAITSLDNRLKPVISRYPGMFLHAERLVFKHPVTGELMDFSAPLPGEFLEILAILRDIDHQENMTWR
jgi:23S rRNA pseudouridine1911/1915/1917 synthase